MKNIVLKSTLAFLLLSFILLNSSCKKHKDISLNLAFNYKINNSDFAYNQVYTINGVAVKFSLAQMYISGINIEDDALRTESFANKYLLVSPESPTKEIGLITNKDIAHLHHIRFSFGINSTTNNQSAAEFSARTAPDPLAAQNPSMDFGAGNGYIFLRIDAMVDTDADGIPETAAEFHIGGNSYLQAFDFIAHNDLENGANTFGINFNIAKLFDGVDLSTEYFTNSNDNPTLAGKIKLNLPAAFTFVN
jgi:hypothetical protein